MLNIYDRQIRNETPALKKTAVLQNAFDIVETHELNQIYTLSFSLPATDEKTEFCQPRHFVRWGDDGELYRIKCPKQSEGNIDVITYECEHVITTLCDDIMFGSFQYVGGSVRTADTINCLLGNQKTVNWRLDQCDFSRKFEYLWEQENILNALYSIPKEFATPYKWVFDTTTYPWKLSLKAIDPEAKPEYYLRAKSNILASGTSADYANICTRIYPLGYGEGVNQLNIKEAKVSNIVYDGDVPVNGTVDEDNGVKYGNVYIQSPADIVAKYGIVEKVLVDRRFEHANTLFAYAQTMLEAYQSPSMSRSFDVTDLYPLTAQSWDDAEVGKICRMTQDNTTAYITKVKRQWDKAGDLAIDLSTKATDIASSVADLADRIRIESVYSQGATQLYQHSKDANATKDKGMVMSLYFPEEMRQINKVLMRIKLNKFRAYSQTTTSNGGYQQTLTVSDEKKDITSKTNTGDSTVDVTYGSIDITSKTNTGDSTVKVTYDSIDITSKTNTGNTSVNVTYPEAVVTTGMTAGTSADLTSTQSGGGTGTTSTSGGGTIDVSISGDAYYTEDANWNTQSTIPTSRTYIDDYENYGTQIGTQPKGLHTHDLSGHVDTVTPLASYDYQHTHYLNDLDGTASTEEAGEHSHTVTDYTGHTHGIGREQLQHNHYVGINVTSNNANQVGFAHSHTFSVPSHTHNINISHTHKITIPSKTLSIPCPNHTHKITIPSKTLSIPCPNHTHKITIPSKTLSIPCPSHTHQITIPGWSKTIDIPTHDHGINPGIYEFGTPSSFEIWVGNKKKATVSSTNFNGDITQWLLNNKNQVPRGSWIDVEIRPNDLAYVVCSVFVQGFVQSRGGGNY